MRPTSGQDKKRVGAIDVRPARWQRADTSFSELPEEDPMLAPRVGKPDQIELPTPQRVERVCNTESLRIAAAARS